MQANYASNFHPSVYDRPWFQPLSMAFPCCRLRDDSHSDPEVLGYLTAENAYSDAGLVQLQPLAAELAAEMEGRLNKPNDPVPVRQGAWWYYERQEEGQRFWQRYRRPAQPAQQQQARPADASGGQHSSTAADGSPAWDEVGPSPDAPEQVVLDPNVECEHALAMAAHSNAMQGTSDDSSGSNSSNRSGGGGSADAQHCDVYGSSVSPDGALVAFGVDVGGSEQYNLLVRDISSGRILLPAPLPGTSGDYEWAADSAGLFYVTRDNTTNRPWQVWYISLGSKSSSSGSSSSSGGAAAPVLLWQEDNPAFYLSISCSSSGRFLLLSGASEVTRQVLLMDLQQAAPPRPDAWLAPAPRVHGVQQQVVGHWQSWLFLLVVSPDTPNGELLVAPVDAPQQHTVSTQACRKTSWFGHVVGAASSRSSSRARIPLLAGRASKCARLLKRILFSRGRAYLPFTW
jgi:oligopeptidase B